MMQSDLSLKRKVSYLKLLDPAQRAHIGVLSMIGTYRVQQYSRIFGLSTIAESPPNGPIKLWSI